MGGAGGQGVIQVTSKEKEAIDRLRALGFPEHAAVEAYMVCDKNEEIAANYLFSNADPMGGGGMMGAFGGAAAAQPAQPAANADAQPAADAQPVADANADASGGDVNMDDAAQGNADADNSGDSNDAAAPPSGDQSSD